MRVLVTGGAGFIGSHLVEHFQGQAEVRVLGSTSITVKAPAGAVGPATLEVENPDRGLARLGPDGHPVAVAINPCLLKHVLRGRRLACC